MSGLVRTPPLNPMEEAEEVRWRRSGTGVRVDGRCDGEWPRRWAGGTGPFRGREPTDGEVLNLSWRGGGDGGGPLAPTADGAWSLIERVPPRVLAVVGVEGAVSGRTADGEMPIGE